MNQIAHLQSQMNDNPIPGLTPGQSWDLGEAAGTITDGSGGATWDIYEPIYY